MVHPKHLLEQKMSQNKENKCSKYLQQQNRDSWTPSLNTRQMQPLQAFRSPVAKGLATDDRVDWSTAPHIRLSVSWSQSLQLPFQVNPMHPIYEKYKKMLKLD